MTTYFHRPPLVKLKVLMIKQFWMDKILDGHKTLEIRSKRVKQGIGKTIWLAASGSSAIFGSVELVACLGPLTQSEWDKMRCMHLVPQERPYYGARTFAYVLQNPQRLPECISFERKKGAVTWQDVELEMP